LIRSKQKTRGLALCLVAALTLCSGNAQAGGGGDSVQGQAFEVCGNWVLKLRDFGKEKVNNYNSWVPENFQTSPGKDVPTMTFAFGATNFILFLGFPNQQGVPQAFVIQGSYEQKGKKLTFQPNAAGIVSLGTIFAELSENTLFGDPERQLVVDIPYQEITNPNNLRFKGRLKGGDRLKVKFKARMLYDIQFRNDSEFADIFNAKGRLKLRVDTRNCPDTPPPSP
jgi:hypothetical protein